MGVTAVYPGSFDPVTNGHLDLMQRASVLFDEIVVAVLRNPGKEGVFSLSRRLSLLQEATQGMARIRVDTFDGLLVDYAGQVGAEVIVRGLRAVSDFEYEFQMALMNRSLWPEIEVIFMAPATSYTFLSSSLVREVASLGGDVSAFVPPIVLDHLVDHYGPSVAGH